MTCAVRAVTRSCRTASLTGDEPTCRLQHVIRVQTDVAKGLDTPGWCLALRCVVSHAAEVLDPAQVIVFLWQPCTAANCRFPALAKHCRDREAPLEIKLTLLTRLSPA